MTALLQNWHSYEETAGDNESQRRGVRSDEEGNDEQGSGRGETADEETQLLCPKKGKGTAYFESVPDEVVYNVFEFLSPTELIAMQKVDKRFAGVSKDVTLWQKLARGHDWEPADGTADTQTYLERFKSSYLAQKAAEEKARRDRLEMQRQKRIDVWAHVMLFSFFNKVAEWVCLLCVLAFTILACYKLEYRIEAGWEIVCIPLYIVVGVFVAAPALLCTAQCTTNFEDYDGELARDEHALSISFFRLMIWRPFEDSEPRTVVPFWWIIAQAVALVALVSCKLCGGALLWSVAFVPLYTFAATLIACFLACKPACWDDDDFLDRLLWHPVFICVGVAAGLLGAQLDGLVHLSWHVALIPLYLALAFAAIALVVNFAMGCNGSSDRLSDSDWLMPTIMVGFFMFVIPLFVFVPLVAAMLDGTTDTTWVSLFTPIWVMDALAVIVCLGGHVIYSD